MKSLTGNSSSVRGWALLLALLLGAGMMISACGDEETPAPTTPAPPPPAPPPPAPEPTPEPTGPATPENLRESGKGSDYIEWSWNAVEGALGYQGQFSTDSTFEPADPTFLIVAPQTSHRVGNLAANTKGYFRVRSGAGTSLTDLEYSDWSAGVSGTTEAPPAPAPAVPLSAPSGVDTSDEGNSSITVTWNGVDGADVYEVEQQAEGGSWVDASCGGADNEVSGTECVASDLDRGTDYRFRVRAVPASANTESTVSAWSTSDTASTTGTQPREPVTGGDDVYEITWESAHNAANTNPHSITWTWSRPDDGRIRFLYKMMDAAADQRNACPALDATWMGHAEGGLPQYSYTTDTASDGSTALAAGHVARLCVVPTWTDDNAQRYGDVFSAWAATVPATNAAVGDIALGPKVNSDRQATTAIDWYLQVDQDFTYEVQTVSAIVGEGLPQCGSGSGHSDLTSREDNDVQRFRLGSVQTYTTYAACVRATNDDGDSGWAKLIDPADPNSSDSGEYSTLPGPPPAAGYVGRRNNTNAVLAAGDANWRFTLGARLPEQSGRYEGKVFMWNGLNTAGDAFAPAVRPDQDACESVPANYLSLGAVTITEEGGSFLVSAADLPSRNGSVATAQARAIYACVRAGLSANENVGSTAPHNGTNGPWSIGSTTVTLKVP